MPLVSCENLALSYDSTVICSDINFSINGGDYLCVVGENGSGKSTLIKTLVGLKSPYSGSVLYGEGLTRADIGYLPQQLTAQNDFPASVGEVVLSGRLNKCGMRPFYSRADRAAADGEMERLGILDLKKRPFSKLSGGQRQRVLLARALCSAVKLIILDEPAAGLDPVVTHEMYHTISAINKSGVAVVMVSHDIACAVRYASHILHLQKTPLFFGTSADYASSDAGRKFLEAQPCPAAAGENAQSNNTAENIEKDGGDGNA